MQLVIDEKVFEQHPKLKIGAIIIRDFNNKRRVSDIESLLRGVCAQRGKEFADKDVYEEPMVDVWSQAYGKFGVNPKKYPPSIAALLKRVKSGKELPHINLLVDLYNYFSLKYLLPIGGEDLDWLCGDLKLTFTKGKEAFRPMGSVSVDEAKEGELCYIDDGGITCRYWNHRECERTKFTEKTGNAIILVEDLSGMHMDQFGKILNDMQSNLIRYVGGQIEPYILSEESRSVDLGVQGRTNVNDAKVPKQEKAHFEEVKKTESKDEKKDETPKTPKKKGENSSSSSKAGKPLRIEDKSHLNEKVKELFVKSLKKMDPKFAGEVHVEYPAASAHGDYSSNMAMRLAKQFQKSPQDIAADIVKNFPKSELVEEVTIAGPGFINIKLSDDALKSEVEKVVKEGEKYGTSTAGKDRTVIVEYSQPNIAKPLGVHHLLSTIIGQTNYNLFKFLGFNAVSINHVGDWGTQFGKLIYAYKTWGDKATVEKAPIDELLKLYVKYHNEVEKDPTLDDKGREEFRKFEKGDKENRELWQWIVDESMKEVEGTYDKLGGIHFDYIQGESFYEDKMDEILEDGKKNKVFVKGEEGAFVAEFDDPNMPTVPVQKKDGATLYITRDFAALKYRIDHWNPEKILYVVDVAQSLHFKQIFATADQLGWYKGQGEHVVFGRMKMKDVNMSTRKGTVIKLDEVLDEAVKRAGKIKKEVAREVGIGSIKYNILSQNRITDITFDWDRMLSLDGNSAPYLQYSYARAKSILKKASETPDEEIHEEDSEKINAKIRELISFFPKFGEQLIQAATEYKPNIISNYLFELAQRFNSFYNSVPVLRTTNKDDRAYRLQVVEAAAQILKNGLAILGVEVVEEM